ERGEQLAPGVVGELVEGAALAALARLGGELLQGRELRLVVRSEERLVDRPGELEGSALEAHRPAILAAPAPAAALTAPAAGTSGAATATETAGASGAAAPTETAGTATTAEATRSTRAPSTA